MLTAGNADVTPIPPGATTAPKQTFLGRNTPISNVPPAPSLSPDATVSSASLIDTLGPKSWILHTAHRLLPPGTGQEAGGPSWPSRHCRLDVCIT